MFKKGDKLKAVGVRNDVGGLRYGMVVTATADTEAGIFPDRPYQRWKDSAGNTGICYAYRFIKH